MEPVYTLFAVIMLVGAAHGLFLALALINTRDARAAGRSFLALLTLAFAIDLGHEFLYQSHYLLNTPALRYVDPIINLVYGPALYLYVRALTGGISFTFTRIHWLHFLPFILAAIVCIAIPELSSGQFIHLYYDDAMATSGDEKLVHTVISSIALASVFSIGLYLFFSFRCLLLHARLVRQQFSSIEKITLNWLRNLLLAFSVLYFILISGGFFTDATVFDDDLNSLLYLMIVAVIYTMGYIGIRQPAIFSNRESASSLQSAQANAESALNNSGLNTGDQVKYKTSALDPAMSAALNEELQRHMKTERPYLESQLTLPQLARQLGISPNYLSQVINEQHQMNFFDFINEYRVAEAKSILTREKTRSSSIINIAYDAGFNSKSAFYSAFKKHVGITPGEFRKTVSG